MFNDFNSRRQLPTVLDHIERIQRDFLSLAGSHFPDAIEKIVAEAMFAAARNNTPAAMNVIENLRVTKYQNPLYQRELAVASQFVVNCFNQYNPPEGISLDSGYLEDIPFATVLAPALTGFVYEMDVFGNDQPKAPCIFLSQHCTQTAWVCSYVRRLIKGMATEKSWSHYVERRDVTIPIVPKVSAAVAQETMKAFFCDGQASEAKHYFDADPDGIEAVRMLVSFLLAHEYSHVCHRHRARRNDDSPLALSTVRLRDLAEISEVMSQKQRLHIPIKPHRLKYFLGHQQDELEADLLAFIVLYEGVCNEERCESLLPVFFRQVCFSILWCDINEVIGRICLNGTSWLSEPLYKPEFCLLSDITWRNRYPSAHSRLGYLYDRAKIALKDAHIQVFEAELLEAEILFSVWRACLINNAEFLASLLNPDDPQTKSFRDSFVWKGLPQSVKGSIGYNNPTETFEIYRWQDYLQDK